MGRPLRHLAARVAPLSAPQRESSDAHVAMAASPASMAMRPVPKAKTAPASIERPQETIASILPERDLRSPARRTTRKDPTREEPAIAAADQRVGPMAERPIATPNSDRSRKRPHPAIVPPKMAPQWSSRSRRARRSGPYRSYEGS